jgi:hypothetical protein
MKERIAASSLHTVQVKKARSVPRRTHTASFPLLSWAGEPSETFERKTWANIATI